MLITSPIGKGALSATPPADHGMIFEISTAEQFPERQFINSALPMK